MFCNRRVQSCFRVLFELFCDEGVEPSLFLADLRELDLCGLWSRLDGTAWSLLARKQVIHRRDFLKKGNAAHEL